MTFGARIRSHRKAVGLSLSGLAERTGLSKPFLSKVERGLASPRLETLAAIADALGVESADLPSEGDGSRLTVTEWTVVHAVRRLVTN
mgnify:CR=1 FL=1